MFWLCTSRRVFEGGFRVTRPLESQPTMTLQSKPSVLIQIYTVAYGLY